MTKGPLQGIRITEFTSAWAGPYATCLLAFLGAEVVKVESRRRIDHSRYIVFSMGKVFTSPNESSVFDSLNLNKKSVCLNLSKPEAIEVAKKLAAKSDIVIENMRPGVMPRLGLGYDVLSDIKQDLIYLSSSSCGQIGPDREFIGYAPNFASIGGLSHDTGYPDWPPSNLMGFIDLKSATTAAYAMLMALIHHQKTGEGQYIDLASQETVAILNSDMLLDYIMNGRENIRKGNKDEIMSPHNCFPCKGEDRWISIAVSSDEEWQSMCTAMEKPELAADERFSDMYNRWVHQEALDEIIGGWTSERDDYEVMKRLQGVGVSAAPSLSSERLFADPHLAEREAFHCVEHPVIGKNWVVAPPWRLSETPAEINRHSPLLGEHNDEVLNGLLGISREEIERLQAKEVVY